LLRVAHIQAFKRTQSLEELRKVTPAQVRRGSCSNEGFRYVPEIDISIPGVDAGHTWEYALRLAVYLKVPLNKVARRRIRANGVSNLSKVI
jgi:hypothetical protein